MKILALKIHANTSRAYEQGVPVLMEMLDKADIGASFFFAMGSERSGSAFSKLFGESRGIASPSPGILREAYLAGYDCGVYGWNPLEWTTRFDRIGSDVLEDDIKRSVEYFARTAGSRPNGFSAPGFRANAVTLRIQDSVRFKYCSDTFGFYPHFPRISSETFKTPQIPAALPPLELVLQGRSETEIRALMEALVDQLGEGLNVLPVSAHVATVREVLCPLRDFLLRCKDEGVKFMDLNSVIKHIDHGMLCVCEVRMVLMDGFSGEILMQYPDTRGGL